MLTSPSTPHEDERQHNDSCSTSRRYLGTVYDRCTHFKIIQKPLSHVSSSIPLPPPLPSDISCGILRSYICFTVSSIPNLPNSSSSTLTCSTRASALRYRSQLSPIPSQPCMCRAVDRSISSATKPCINTHPSREHQHIHPNVNVASSNCIESTSPNITRSISPLCDIHHMRNSRATGILGVFRNLA
jgi:hypothetical protein